MSTRPAPITVVLARGDRELARGAIPLRGERADLATIDTLARLQVNARRHGCSIRIEDPPPCVLALLDLTGLVPLFFGRDR